MKYMSAVMVAALLCLVNCLHAYYDDSPPCMRALALSFFDEQSVGLALQFYDVQQSLWTPTYRSLAQQAPSVWPRVQQRARHMHPNPLSRPVRGPESLKLLDDELLATWRQVILYLVPLGIVDDSSITTMFTYIKKRHTQEWQACLDQIANRQEKLNHSVLQRDKRTSVNTPKSTLR